MWNLKKPKLADKETDWWLPEAESEGKMGAGGQKVQISS